MSLFTEGISKGAAKGIGVSSVFASTFHSPAVEKIVMSAIARFLPDGIGDSLVEMTDIIHKLFPELSVVDIRITLSILAILQYRCTKPVYEIRKYQSAEDSPIAKSFVHFMKYATAAYGRTPLIDKASMLCSSDRDWIRTHTGLAFEKIYPYIDARAVSGRHMLEHYVAVDDAQKSVIIALKGTLTVEGAMKDLRSSYSNVEVWNHHFDVHTGMWKAAQDLISFPPLLAQVTQELKANPDYKLVVLGHSLGGGVAILVAALLAAEPTGAEFLTNSITFPGRRIVCYGFEPAASIDEEFAKMAKALMYTVVNKNDIVPSLSHGAILDFKITALKLKNDPDYLATIIDGLLTNKLNADKELNYLRSLAKNKKLVPGGRVWAMDMDDRGKLEIGEVLNVNQRFGEARFIMGMIVNHTPADCVASLATLLQLE